MRIDFIQDGRYINGSPDAQVDADCVRVWDGDVCVVELTADNSVSKPGPARWTYTGSDMGHTYSDALLSGEWDTWQDGLSAYGIDHEALAVGEAC